ncbi:unnamed protein product [Closterium sp. NIES-64]|nr:unnamed protein product [Closterium sp. NIES-64]
MHFPTFRTYLPPYLSSYSQPINLFKTVSAAPNGSIFFSSPSSNASWGAAFIQRPITLFLSTRKKTPCDLPIAFRMTPTSAGGSSKAGEGLAFVVTAAAPQEAAAGVGLGGVGKRSVAVEFDSVLSVKHSDPNDNHVGVNVGGSPVSLASATAPLILNDGHTKHAWIHYDPTSSGTLRVFLSASRQQLSKAVLMARVSLCSALKPTIGNASFLFGFVAASNSIQRHDILWWNIVTADSSAYAVVAAVEAAYSIASNASQPPRLSVEQLRLALLSNCDDMPPRDVLAFLGFEESLFGGWLGLLLAVQRQPVIVRIEVSAPSFLDYDGTRKYSDASCFQDGVNHAVLVVGYSIKGELSSPFSLPAPLWVIRNSWGSEWGAAGHMFMDMQSGPGVCGINTLPGIFPILRSTADPCGSKSVMLEGSSEVPASNALNLCGQFKCSKAGASNRCTCATSHFVQAAHPDGSNTCAYGDSKGSYTVRGSNVWCSHLVPVLDLTLDEIKQQNKGCPVEGEACEEALVGLNPGLDCAALTGRQAVCVEREESKAGMVAVCDRQYEMEGSDGCDSARMDVNPPLSPLEFYRLNPGINCNNRLPTATIQGFSQRKVCIHSSTRFRIGTCPGGTYNISAGDTCAKIDVLGFSSIKGCYRKINGFECLEKTPAGTIVCTPNASSANVG